MEQMKTISPFENIQIAEGKKFLTTRFEKRLHLSACLVPVVLSSVFKSGEKAM
jgi:hypothetical protein